MIRISTPTTSDTAVAVSSSKSKRNGAAMNRMAAEVLDDAVDERRDRPLLEHGWRGYPKKTSAVSYSSRVEQLRLGQRLVERHALDLGPAQRDHLAEVALGRPRRSPRRRSACRARGRRRAACRRAGRGRGSSCATRSPCAPRSRARASTAIPPSRTWPNASVPSRARSQTSPSFGVAPSATTTIENVAPAARGGGVRRSQTSSMSNGRSGTRITSAPPAMPE